jgi:nucleoside-diphosphate-sugar epimerase
MRVLVIGGTKFIGPYLVRLLYERGHEITVFHRGENETVLPAQVRHVHDPRAAMPITEFPKELLEPASDIVIHMIAMGEADARAAVSGFGKRASRIVWLSSGDVYRAYGRIIGIEPPAKDPGQSESGLLNEDSPLRTVLYPYRKPATAPNDLGYYYEKILVEKAAFADPATPSVVLRLPKVYGPESNRDLATVYRYRHLGSWRWTHGYVENVAEAIVLAATHPAAVRRTYNVGEEHTPTVEGRLKSLPPSGLTPDDSQHFAVLQDIAYDTSRIRSELGYRERIAYEEGIRRTLGDSPRSP